MSTENRLAGQKRSGMKPYWFCAWLRSISACAVIMSFPPVYRWSIAAWWHPSSGLPLRITPITGLLFGFLMLTVFPKFYWLFFLFGSVRSKHVGSFLSELILTCLLTYSTGTCCLCRNRRDLLIASGAHQKAWQVLAMSRPSTSSRYCWRKATTL